MTPSDRPAWLEHIEERIKEEQDDWEGDAVPHEIVRDLLLTSDDDDAAMTKAFETFEANYVAGFTREDTDELMPKRQPPEYHAGLFLNGIAHAVVDTMQDISFTDPKHDKLVELLVAIKHKAASEFDRKNPKFVYYSWGLEEAARDGIGWQSCGWTKDSEMATARQKADRWINASALMAKLYQIGLLAEYGPIWVVGDFETAFMKTRHGDLPTNIGRQAEVLVPINHILLAGEALLKTFQAFQERPNKVLGITLDRAMWMLWAEKIQEVADIVDEVAPWDLKRRAQEAHDKMVVLFPEALEEG